MLNRKPVTSKVFRLKWLSGGRRRKRMDATASAARAAADARSGFATEDSAE